MPEHLHPNLTLRRLMAEHGFTREGLAEALNDSAERRFGQRGNCTARHVGRWLKGEVAWPRTASRLPLEAVFGRSAVELGFRPPASATVGAAAPTSPPALPQDSPVIRRKFVLGLGTLIALPALPESGRLGMSDVARVRAAEAQLVQLDRRYGSAQLADMAGRYVEHVEHVMRRCTYGGRVQTQLHQALGEMCDEAAWLAYDCGRQGQAQSRWDTALRYALLAGDSMLQARIWAGMSRQAADLGHGGEAVAIARAALATTRGRRDPRLSALLHTRVALGHSVEGEKGRCVRSLHRAEQELDRASGPAPAWLEFCGLDELVGQTALCFYHLGDYARAAKADRDSLRLVAPNTFRRNEFATHVSLARNLLATGDADGALEAGHDALKLLPQVRSQRWSTHLANFRDDVLSCAPQGTADFADRYRKATK